MWTRIQTIWVKELIDNLRDRRALSQALIVPLFLGVVYALINPLMGSLIESRIESAENVQIQAIGRAFITDGLKTALSQAAIDLVDYNGTEAEFRAAVEKGTPKVGIIFSENFNQAMTDEKSAELTILVNSSGGIQDIDTSSMRLTAAIQVYNNILVTERLNQRNIPLDILTPIAINTVSLTTPEQTAGQNSSMFIPILVGVVIVSGGMFVALDVTAGEKERGTLEALLLTPATDFEIFTGKLAAVFTMTIFPLALTFLGYGMVTNFLPDSLGKGAYVPPIVMIGSVVVAMPLALTINILLMILAIRTKTFKDAQSAVAPATMGVVFPSMIAMFFPAKSLPLFLIPLYGTTSAASQLASTSQFPTLPFLFSAIGCLAVSAALFPVAMKLFNRERLLYSR